MSLSGIALQPESKDPLYRQLFDQIVTRIRTGTFPPGYRLPPTRVLAKELSTHRNTVVHAYEDLEAGGFVRSTVGRGTFVLRLMTPAPAPTDSTASQGPLPWASLLSSCLKAEPLTRSERLSRSLASAGAINLNRFQPSADLIPYELLRRCLDHILRTLGPRALEYAPREGLTRLRSLIAEDLVRQGVPASADDLIITTGSQQALDMLARILVEPGDAFLVDHATYSGALSLLSLARARLIGVASDGEGPDVSVIEQHGRSGTKGFYLMPNCQNPTGRRVSLDRRRALVRWSHETGVPLIEDDYASDLIFDDEPRLPALRTLDGEVIYVGTFSKKLAPALRIGYLLCPRVLHSHLTVLKHAMDLGTSGLLQHVLAEFLDRGYLSAHLGMVQAEYRRRRDALEEGLAKHLPKEVRWDHPRAGVTLWLPTPPYLDVEALFREAQRQGVLVSPGTLNGVAPADSQGLRLTFCAEPPERLAEGARRLGKAWAVLERLSRAQTREKAAARLETV